MRKVSFFETNSFYALPFICFFDLMGVEGMYEKGNIVKFDTLHHYSF